jgi:hypothetical protein
MAGDLEHYFQSFEEHANIFDLTAGMHVHAGNSYFGTFYNTFNMPDLVYGNTKFAINVTGRYFEITPSHNMRIEPDANRIAAAKLIAKLL